MTFYSNQKNKALTVLMAGIKHMVEVYNFDSDPDDMIKIVVLPNNEDGKTVYDFANEIIKENIE